MPQTIDTIICCQSYAQIKWHFLRQKASLVCNSEFSLNSHQTLGSSRTHHHLYFHIV